MRLCSTYRIQIHYGAIETVFDAATERGLCILTETRIRQLHHDQLSAVVWVECQDVEAQKRVADYLGTVILELADEP
ncbi:hypothetical protein [Methylorubrum extorquens]